MDHRAAADYLARRLKESLGGELQRVILYGSVARGEATPQSDVDVMIVGRSWKRVHEALGPILGDLVMEDAPVMSTIVMSTEQFEEFARRGNWMYRAILSDGEDLAA